MRENFILPHPCQYYNFTHVCFGWFHHDGSFNQGKVVTILNILNYVLSSFGGESYIWLFVKQVDTRPLKLPLHFLYISMYVNRFKINSPSQVWIL